MLVITQYVWSQSDSRVYPVMKMACLSQVCGQQDQQMWINGCVGGACRRLDNKMYSCNLPMSRQFVLRRVGVTVT